MPYVVAEDEDFVLRVAASLEYLKLGKSNLTARAMKPYMRVVVDEARWDAVTDEHTDDTRLQTAEEYETTWTVSGGAPIFSLAGRKYVAAADRHARGGASVLMKGPEKDPAAFIEGWCDLFYTNIVDTVGRSVLEVDTGLLFSFVRLKKTPSRLVIVNSCFSATGPFDANIMQRLVVSHYTYELWGDEKMQDDYVRVFRDFLKCRVGARH